MFNMKRTNYCCLLLLSMLIYKTHYKISKNGLHYSALRLLQPSSGNAFL